MRRFVLFITIGFLALAGGCTLGWISELATEVGNYGWDGLTVTFVPVLILAVFGFAFLIYIWYQAIILDRKVEIKVAEKKA